jgi:hypothetical protein
MEYTIEEIKLLYRSSPAKVFEKLKTGDKLYADDDSLNESLRIMSICKIAYHLNTGKIAERNVHEIIIN